MVKWINATKWNLKVLNFSWDPKTLYPASVQCNLHTHRFRFHPYKKRQPLPHISFLKNPGSMPNPLLFYEQFQHSIPCYHIIALFALEFFSSEAGINSFCCLCSFIWQQVWFLSLHIQEESSSLPRSEHSYHFTSLLVVCKSPSFFPCFPSCISLLFLLNKLALLVQEFNKIKFIKSDSILRNLTILPFLVLLSEHITGGTTVKPYHVDWCC